MDRAALDIALKLNIPCGGWCPKDRLAEDGVIPARYPLTETESRKYDKRTKRNVQDADGTLILHRGPLDGGTDYTSQVAKRIEKPCLAVDLAEPVERNKIIAWLQEHDVNTLNVAGPRESKCPGIQQQAGMWLRTLFQR